jgi:hypothetical protein
MRHRRPAGMRPDVAAGQPPGAAGTDPAGDPRENADLAPLPHLREPPDVAPRPAYFPAAMHCTYATLSSSPWY